MISEQTILRKFNDFTQVASPVLSLKDSHAYEEALVMVEHLMESVGEDESRMENLLISLLTNAIDDYESSIEPVTDFIYESMKGKGDIAILRFIINQHQLTFSDLPEIGHKSLVSKILSGERQLTRTHINKLCKRFNINPQLFF